MNLNKKLDNNTQIFISKDVSNSVLLCNYLEANGIQYVAKSLLNFEEIKIEGKVPKVDVLFFASPRSFDFYVGQETITTEVIACAGESTAKYIQSKGFTVDFYPKLSGLVTDAAKEFANWVDKRKVGFSISNLSKRSYSQFLEIDQVVVIPTYQTLYDTSEIPLSNYYVFTSPSNVDAFLLANTISANARIISWGETTTSHLKALNIAVYHTLSSSSDEALISFFHEEFLSK